MELVLRFEKARDLFRAYPKVLDAITLRPKGHHSLDFIELLIASPKPEEAIIFLAYLLSKRQAVWWAHECLSLSALSLEETDHRLSDMAVEWVATPNGANQARAFQAAREIRPKSAAAWLALAAGWSEDTSPEFAHWAVCISVQESLRSFPAREQRKWARDFRNNALRTQYAYV